MTVCPRPPRAPPGACSVPPPQPSLPASTFTWCIGGGAPGSARPGSVMARGSPGLLPAAGRRRAGSALWRRVAKVRTPSSPEPSRVAFAGRETWLSAPSPRAPVWREPLPPHTRRERSAQLSGWIWGGFLQEAAGKPGRASCCRMPGAGPAVTCWEGLRPGEARRKSEAFLILNEQALTASVPAALPSQPRFL